MARTTKQAKKKVKPTVDAAVQGARKTPRAAKRSGAGGETDVERQWREYREHRATLEKAVAALHAAEQVLAGARELERGRREAFERAKASLTALLEVDPAPAAAARGLLDFPKGEGRRPQPDKTSHE